jgi:sugar phosphate isomerase/epimerase
MYFAMDSIGFENEAKIKSIELEADKWKFIYNTATSYGFEGIHFESNMYRGFGLDLNNIPDYFNNFRLTYHYGGFRVTSEKDYEMIDNELENVFKIAIKHNMHDVSIHPPYIDNVPLAEKILYPELFHKAIDKWLKIAIQNGISLSLETHVTGQFFLFNGLNEYAKFVDIYPDLGVLIDISHNYYDKFSENDVINTLGNKNIKGFHLSDALQDVDFRKGTHLAIGDGTVDFSKLLNYFKNFPDLYCALELRASNEEVSRSLKNLKNIITN